MVACVSNANQICIREIPKRDIRIKNVCWWSGQEAVHARKEFNMFSSIINLWNFGDATGAGFVKQTRINMFSWAKHDRMGGFCRMHPSKQNSWKKPLRFTTCCFIRLAVPQAEIHSNSDKIYYISSPSSRKEMRGTSDWRVARIFERKLPCRGMPRKKTFQSPILPSCIPFEYYFSQCIFSWFFVKD